MTTSTATFLSDRDLYTIPEFSKNDDDVKGPETSIEIPEKRLTLRVPKSAVSLSNKFVEVLKLKENWNGPRSQRIDPWRVAYALEILRDVLSPGVPMPYVIPTNDGGVQLEWHRSGIDIELEILSPRQAELYYSDRKNSEEWSGVLGSHYGNLTSVLERLK